MTLLGMEPATFRLVVQYLKQLRHRVPRCILCVCYKTATQFRRLGVTLAVVFPLVAREPALCNTRRCNPLP